MNPIIAASNRTTHPEGLEQVEVLHQLQLMTGVLPIDWLAPLNESPEQQAARLEFRPTCSSASPSTTRRPPAASPSYAAG
ncbi:hypothetical protein [Streptomyces sp. NPDC058279]|uniref:hypothetical protein n=1 Tax=Streptomyces sp. NPDC058279 TaxID=3346418 RepID=UPI0036EABB8E